MKIAMLSKINKFCFLFSLFIFPIIPIPVYSKNIADENSPIKKTKLKKKAPDFNLGSLLVSEEKENKQTQIGSNHILAKDQLEKFKYEDIHRILNQIPGIYIRDEEGFGLRPNIGMRGAASERSSKITLMEDGVLLAPAPYSAPAAYYFPVSARMESIETYKGPSSIAYGPNTIGGALNFRTKKVPFKDKGSLDIGLGQFLTGKIHSYFGHGDNNYGILLEGIRLQSDGIKKLENSQSTGFYKNEFMVKARYNNDLNSKIFQQSIIKVGFSNEISNETYLGLSEKDFNQDPYQRYPASQKGKMKWRRIQGVFSYFVSEEDNFNLLIDLYHHDFIRDWNKFSGFSSMKDASKILRNPESPSYFPYYQVLKGLEDSNPGSDLLIGSNDRSFLSQGIQSKLNLDFKNDQLKNRISFGLRYHFDSIVKKQTQKSYLMRNSKLIQKNEQTRLLSNSEAKSIAWAVYLQDQLDYKSFSFVPGIRFEKVKTIAENLIEVSRKENDYQVILPGIGIFYEIFKNFGVLAGVHKGFSPLSPGQAEEVKPEESLNYEGGFRYEKENQRFETIAFFNDYKNLIGACSQSSGCREEDAFKQYNAGKARIYGLEVSGFKEFKGFGALIFSAGISYTFTKANFLSKFDSKNSLYGMVENGDSLPYIPNHQGSFRGSLKGDDFSLNSALNLKGEMRDSQGQGEIQEKEKIPAHMVLDVSAHYFFNKKSSSYLKVDNLLATKYLVALRPYGLRPGKPFHLSLGFKYDF